MRLALCIAAALSLIACADERTSERPNGATRIYFDNSDRDDVLSGGVKMIPIATPKGTFRVWTKRIGNNPRAKVLLLHGGPAATHEYFEAFDSFLPGAGVEYYYYDQLGSAFSDQPADDTLWDLPRFVEEVEQVRTALHLDHLKGLVISNMMSSIPAYNEYAKRVLMPAMDPKVLAEVQRLEASGQYSSPRYMELLVPNFYAQHILRMPPDQWPDPVNRAFKRLNEKIYVQMQGPSEMGASGTLAGWDRTADLGRIAVPTLVIGARYDTMDPAHMAKMAGQVKKGRYLFCANGSHLAMYDDQKTYFDGLTAFVHDVVAGRF